MMRSGRRNQLKLMGSLAVLAVVFVIAAIAQFKGDHPPNPYTANAKVAEPPEIGRERAVFGEERPNPTADSPVAPHPPASSAAAETADPEPDQRARAAEPTSPPAGVNELLERWRRTVILGDVNAQTILYAPQMERFFNRKNVTREQVRREKGRMMELYPNVSRYEISDLKVEAVENGQTVVSFRKEWDMHGDKHFSGAERQRLKLRRIAGDWKIVSEEET